MTPEAVAALEPTLAARYATLVQLLQRMGRVIVGFSGGVDSTFLLAVAVRALGQDALAVTGLSPSLAASEREEAMRLARSLGAPHRVIETGEMSVPGYVANAPDRCYFCKSDLFERLTALARAEGYAAVVDGSNLDDVGDFRPGREAAKQLGVRSPLMEAKLSKRDIRDLSRALGLPTAEKPAMACLASRIPHGIPVTIERLGQVEQAEAGVRALGFPEVRVRHHEAIARIELPPSARARFLDEETVAEVVRRVKAAGYQFVVLDLEGYRPGGRPKS